MCPKHEQNDIGLMNFFSKIHARYSALIAIQNTYIFTHSLFSCQGTEKIKENRLQSRPQNRLVLAPTLHNLHN